MTVNNFHGCQVTINYQLSQISQAEVHCFHKIARFLRGIWDKYRLVIFQNSPKYHEPPRYLSRIPLETVLFPIEICYKLLLDLNPVQPRCIRKFTTSFGSLDWPATWKSSCRWTEQSGISVGRLLMECSTPQNA